MKSETVFLASSSPRRQQLLGQMGIRFSLIDAPIDETPLQGESAPDFVERMAHEKANAGAHKVFDPDAWVIAGDTAIVLDGKILGKPENSAAAEAMLQNLSGRAHQVYSSVAVSHKDRIEVALNITEVLFSEFSPKQIEDYVATGEPLDKAGSYAIQGQAAKWVKNISGSYYAVMGLPIYELTQVLQKMGFSEPL